MSWNMKVHPAIVDADDDESFNLLRANNLECQDELAEIRDIAFSAACDAVEDLLYSKEALGKGKFQVTIGGHATPENEKNETAPPALSIYIQKLFESPVEAEAGTQGGAEGPPPPPND